LTSSDVPQLEITRMSHVTADDSDAPTVKVFMTNAAFAIDSAWSKTVVVSSVSMFLWRLYPTHRDPV
jgi:hypothetical protein